MNLLGALLAGGIGAEAASLLKGVIDKHGGIQGLTSQFEKQGLGATIKSWIDTGENQPITPDQVHQAVGSDTIKDMAAKLGITPQELSAKLSTMLPSAVDKLTPNGTIPTHQA